MASQSNTGFNQEEALGSALNRHVISFQTGAINSTSEMIPTGNYYATNYSAGNFSGNSSIISNSNPVVTQTGNSHASLLFDSASGLKHDAELAVEWSAEEQHKLEEGLVKFVDEPSIMRYIKIAATLQNKTVRDVALRCRWMMRKRRKQEEFHLGRWGASRKLAEPSSKENLLSASIRDMPSYSLPPHRMDQEVHHMCQAALNAEAKQLLELNYDVFSQISTNLLSLKLQENIDLLCHTKDNIERVHAIMRDMPGRMRQMRELPVSIDQELADRILPCAARAMLF